MSILFRTLIQSLASFNCNTFELSWDLGDISFISSVLKTVLVVVNILQNFWRLWTFHVSKSIYTDGVRTLTHCASR